MWLKEQGYASLTDGFEIKECSTSTCAHCNRITHIKPGCRPEDIGGLCKICMGLICPHCVSEGICDPFMEKLDRMEKRIDALRSYGLL